MPHYPSNFNNISTSNTYNNVVTRRLANRDLVAFAQSPRFGGQWMEPKGDLYPYGDTIQNAVSSIQQLLSELNLIAPLMPGLGVPVILSTVSLATSILTGYGAGANGIAVSYIGGVGGTALSFVSSVDGIGLSTGQRVLFYGLTTASLNGVYGVSSANPGLKLSRVPDLSSWWQFVKPKVFLCQNGTLNAGQTFALQTDAYEFGEAFTVALGTSFGVGATGVSNGIAQTFGTPIVFNPVNYSPGIGTTTSSLIYPPFYTYPGLASTAEPTGYLAGGEYSFLSQNSMAEFVYLKNRAHRLAYRVFKMRENYSPYTSVYQNDVPFAIGLANTANNIGVSTANDLPKGSRYPSSFNRGF